MSMLERRLLLVHAHPDDESIYTGATMAKYAAEAVQVTLVTCTLGELGEIIPPSLAYLAAEKEDRLGEYRTDELAAACAALGVTDHRFLGGPGRWRDSGMMGTEGNEDPRCFWRADVDTAARALLDVIAEVRPQVLVTYDADGAYGHPDHIQAHRVAWRACELAGPDGPARFYATAAAGGAAGHHRDRRERLARSQAGRDARARDADHRGPPVLRLVRRGTQTTERHRVLYPAGRPARRWAGWPARRRAGRAVQRRAGRGARPRRTGDRPL